MIGRRLALLLLVLLAVAAAGSAAASSAPEPAGHRSQPTYGSLERKLDRIERMIERMERTARRWDRWTKCISELPVSEYGDPDHRFGFQYDERDGTGLDLRPALAIDSKAGRRPNLVLFKFSRREGCRSLGTEPTQPGTPGEPGTADPAKLPVQAAARRTSLRALEQRLEVLETREARLERMAEQFDEWESCLSWIPVTEYGDPEGRFGYLYQGKDGERGYRPALAIDRSEWDDPDYMFLGGELSRVHLRYRGGDETDSPPPPTPGTDAAVLQRRAGRRRRSTRCIGSGRGPRTRYAGERQTRGPQPGRGLLSRGRHGPRGAGGGVRHLRSMHAPDRRRRKREPLGQLWLRIRQAPGG